MTSMWIYMVYFSTELAKFIIRNTIPVTVYSFCHKIGCNCDKSLKVEEKIVWNLE